MAIAYIFGKPPTSIITGVGALSALVLLIFRDTILGIVASIQANATSMIRVVDWIVIDKYNIDGNVEEISINSVRIRESDNTIVTIPTYAITTEAVKNMEFMKLSGARRFNEKIFILPESICFINEDFIKKINILLPESNFYNIEITNLTTNLGVFRHYLLDILNNNKNLNENYSSKVRIGNMLPTLGLPLSITGYTIDTSTKVHEQIKADILEIVYASISLFNLKISIGKYGN